MISKIDVTIKVVKETKSTTILDIMYIYKGRQYVWSNYVILTDIFEPTKMDIQFYIMDILTYYKNATYYLNNDTTKGIKMFFGDDIDELLFMCENKEFDKICGVLHYYSNLS